RLTALILGDEHLVELFSGPHPDVLDLAALRDHLDQVLDAHARDLGHEDLAAAHELGAADSKLDAALETDPEPCHCAVRDRDAARRALGLEQRDHAAAAADDIAVADHAQYGAARMAVGIPLDEELFSAQLGGPVQVDRIDGLVGADHDHTL